MKTLGKALTAGLVALTLGIAALGAASSADAFPRGVKSLSGTDLGSGR